LEHTKVQDTVEIKQLLLGEVAFGAGVASTGWVWKEQQDKRSSTIYPYKCLSLKIIILESHHCANNTKIILWISKSAYVLNV
jgi:hypothetical protein